MPLASPTLGGYLDVGDLVARVQAELRGASPAPFDILAGALAADTAEATVAVSLGSELIETGTFVAIGEETLYVKAVSGLTMTVLRGIHNTNVTAHAVGSTVEVAPEYFPSAIGHVLVEEIRSWPIEVGVVRTSSLSFGATDTEIDWTGGPTGFRRLLAARTSTTTGDHPIDADVVVTPNAEAAYASGYAVRRHPATGSAVTAHLTYLGDFALDDVDFATTLADIGLPASLHDVVVYGALWRLLGPREADVLSRTGQPQPRQASDTPPGRTLSAAAGFKQLRDERLEEEVARLRDLYPPRF